MFKIFMSSLLCFYCLSISIAADEPNDVKEQVKKRLQEFTENVNQNKVDALPTFWTENARLIKPTTGEMLKGKEEIGKYLQQRAQEIKERNLKFNFRAEKVTFPAPNKAIVEGVIEITDKDGLIQRNARKIDLMNQNGKWYIDELREIEVAPPPPVFAHLKELEWLIGSWKDQDEDVSITFSTKWDKFKNFLIQHYKMEIYDLEVLEGVQIIGWNPLRERIQSWVFDSDGGYGTGVWFKKDKDWIVTMHYVLSDGNQGTATNIYSNINNRSYTYSSINRNINAEPLDDIKPVTVMKENL